MVGLWIVGTWYLKETKYLALHGFGRVGGCGK
jgi:hypothetical protein